MPTGLLGIDFNTNISSLDGRRLARHGPGNLLANATRFLQNERGLTDGDFIFVTPDAGTTPPLLFVLDAGLQADAPGVSMVATGAKKRPRKSAKKPARKTARKTTKRAAKKAASKPAKKTSQKKSGKKAAKKK